MGGNSKKQGVLFACYRALETYQNDTKKPGGVFFIFPPDESWDKQPSSEQPSKPAEPTHRQLLLGVLASVATLGALNISCALREKQLDAHQRFQAKTLDSDVAHQICYAALRAGVHVLALPALIVACVTFFVVELGKSLVGSDSSSASKKAPEDVDNAADLDLNRSSSLTN